MSSLTSLITPSSPTTTTTTTSTSSTRTAKNNKRSRIEQSTSSSSSSTKKIPTSSSSYSSSSSYDDEEEIVESWRKEVLKLKKQIHIYQGFISVLKEQVADEDGIRSIVHEQGYCFDCETKLPCLCPPDEEDGEGDESSSDVDEKE